MTIKKAPSHHTLSARSACGYTSTAYDPFLDISLDLFPVLEAAKHQEHVATEMRSCSQANTTAAAAVGTGATSGQGVGPVSVMSSQPSVSAAPSDSTPSPSGMTDAFSGVECASRAGPSRCADDEQMEQHALNLCQELEVFPEKNQPR